MTRRPLKIALMGTRGVPAKYGGFETCVEEVGQRLAAKGHQVTVYCRESYYQEKPDRYCGMHLVYLPNVQRKTLDTMSHTLISGLHASFGRHDIYMVFNAANSLLVLPLRILGRKILINTDGLEWKRSKWGFWGRTYYKLSEKAACLVANRLVSDSRGIQEHYEKTHRTKSTKIAYGAYLQYCDRPKKLLDLGLEPFNYFLQITRFEPENNPLLTIQAFNRLNTNKKLVLVGGNPYPTDYVRQIQAEASESVILPGFIYDKEFIEELWCLCFAYVHGNEVGGTNPALLQSMAAGCFTMALDVHFNREVLADGGIFYKKNMESLAEAMGWTLDNEASLGEFKERARNRIVEHYSWEKIADQYEELFYEVWAGKHPWRPRLSPVFSFQDRAG